MARRDFEPLNLHGMLPLFHSSRNKSKIIQEARFTVH